MIGDTHALIADRTAGVEKLATEKAAAGLTHPTCPRASAVAAVLIEKLCGWSTADDVPLEDLVTPSSLHGWRTMFEDAEASAGAITMLSGYQPVLPWVEPQDDGSVAVLLVWVPLEDESQRRVQAPEWAIPYRVYCRVVEAPDDWRVDRIG